MSNNKKKKKKTTYIDDGSTIYDMSALGGGRSFGSSSSFGEKFATYKKAVKQMIIPMLITMDAITVVFGIAYLILTLAE